MNIFHIRVEVFLPNWEFFAASFRRELNNSSEFCEIESLTANAGHLSSEVAFPSPLVGTLNLRISTLLCCTGSKVFKHSKTPYFCPYQPFYVQILSVSEFGLSRDVLWNFVLKNCPIFSLSLPLSLSLDIVYTLKGKMQNIFLIENSSYYTHSKLH